MVTLYASAVLHSWRRGLLLAPALAAAYGFLYTILQSEDFAMLIGSIGLFVILGLVMVLTRRVDWYRVGAPARTPADRPDQEPRRD